MPVLLHGFATGFKGGSRARAAAGGCGAKTIVIAPHPPIVIAPTRQDDEVRPPPEMILPNGTSPSISPQGPTQHGVRVRRARRLHLRGDRPAGLTDARPPPASSPRAVLADRRDGGGAAASQPQRRGVLDLLPPEPEPRHGRHPHGRPPAGRLLPTARRGCGPAGPSAEELAPVAAQEVGDGLGAVGGRRALLLAVLVPNQETMGGPLSPGRRRTPPGNSGRDQGRRQDHDPAAAVPPRHPPARTHALENALRNGSQSHRDPRPQRRGPGPGGLARSGPLQAGERGGRAGPRDTRRCWRPGSRRP
jgi:hypothetical protein